MIDQPVPPAVAVTIPAASHEEHAHLMRVAFAVIRGLLGLATSPAIVALLPPQDREYAAALVAVEQVVTTAVAT